MHCTVLYFTFLYCTVLYCTVLYCTVPEGPVQLLHRSCNQNQQLEEVEYAKEVFHHLYHPLVPFLRHVRVLHLVIVHVFVCVSFQCPCPYPLFFSMSLSNSCSLSVLLIFLGLYPQSVDNCKPFYVCPCLYPCTSVLNQTLKDVLLTLILYHQS